MLMRSRNAFSFVLHLTLFVVMHLLNVFEMKLRTHCTLCTTIRNSNMQHPLVVLKDMECRNRQHPPLHLPTRTLSTPSSHPLPMPTTLKPIKAPIPRHNFMIPHLPSTPGMDRMVLINPLNLTSLTNLGRRQTTTITTVLPFAPTSIRQLIPPTNSAPMLLLRLLPTLPPLLVHEDKLEECGLPLLQLPRR